MADNVEPVEVEETEEIEKAVPASDLIALKKASEGREKKLKVQLAEATKRISELEVDLDVTKKSGGSDEEVEGVQKFLVEERKRVALLEAEAKQKLTEAEKRERTVRVKELSIEYKIDISKLEDVEDYEGEALRLYVERLEEELKKKKAPESKYETSAASTRKKEPKDMDDKELAEYEKRKLAETMAKR